MSWQENSLNLGEIIEFLEQQNPVAVIRYGWNACNSYRGYYEDLAFEPSFDVPVARMLAVAREANGKTFEGYKGGDYHMDRNTTCWIADYGTTSGSMPVTIELLNWMIGRPSVPAIWAVREVIL